MHIPDNYLSPSTCAIMAATMVPLWAIAAKKVKNEISRAKMPLLGVGAAFSFLIMMFNIPLPWGTTGHAVGGTLLSILMGPFAACLSITAALLVQAVMFGDGGILAFGANCFNLAFIMPFLGYFTYKFIKGRVKTLKGEYAAIAIGSYIAINLAAFFAAIEFGLQPIFFKDIAGQALYNPYPLSISIPAMVIPHLLVVGAVEAVFTTAVYTFIKNISPGTIYEGAKEKISAVYVLIVAMICLSPIGLIASGTAWGEWEGVSGMTRYFDFKALLPDYSLGALPEAKGYILSAVFGAAILLILFKMIRRKPCQTG